MLVRHAHVLRVRSLRAAALPRPPAAAAYHVAVVGTGPAGFYTAKYLLKGAADVRVDLLDALPTPFGLVRSGVAPDHPEVKNVMSDFSAVASDPRVQFIGNVALGKDVNVEDLLQLYDQVVLAYGAASDRKLDIPGEGLDGVVSARAFVAWYNGHPYSPTIHSIDAEDVVIVGNGNVAIDCARILMKTEAELRQTDICDAALRVLTASKVKRVHLLGRRGHVQAAFTLKELREVTRLADADLIIHPEELDAGRTPASVEECASSRAKIRLDAFLTEAAKATPAGRRRQLHLRFLRNPVEILPEADGSSRVGSVVCDVTRLEGSANKQSAEATGLRETLPAQLVLRSIGYKSISVPGVPFDDKKSVVRNESGRVVHASGAVFPRLFVSGWLKRGPTGIIGTNITDAQETVHCMLADVSASVPPAAAPAPAAADASTAASVSARASVGVRVAEEAAACRRVDTADPTTALLSLLRSRGKDSASIVSWAQYKAIDEAEKAMGMAKGKPREKITDIATMLKVASTAGELK